MFSEDSLTNKLPVCNALCMLVLLQKTHGNVRGDLKKTWFSAVERPILKLGLPNFR